MVVEAGQTALVLGDQLRLEGGLPVARNIQFQLAVGRDDRLGTAAVAVIAALALLGLAGQMVRQFGGKTSAAARAVCDPAPAPGSSHCSTAPARARVATCTGQRYLQASRRTSDLKLRTMCGFNPWACQWRMTVLALTPNSAAILRVLQCVAATGLA